MGIRVEGGGVGLVVHVRVYLESRKGGVYVGGFGGR